MSFLIKAMKSILGNAGSVVSDPATDLGKKLAGLKKLFSRTRLYIKLCDDDAPLHGRRIEWHFCVKMPSVRAVNWCFTLNNYTDADVERIEGLGDQVRYAVVGKEVGESGTPHLQGFVRFQARVTMQYCKNTIGGNPHVETTRNVNASIQYCKKDGDYFEVGEIGGGAGSRSDLDEFKEAVKGGMLSLKEIRETHTEVYAKYPRFCLEYIRDNLPNKELPAHPLRAWQQELNTELNRAPDDRTVKFVVDLNGNSGKTWFAHYYGQLHENVQVMQPGPKKDMAYALDPTIRVLFMDAPRSKQGEFIQYDFLEDVKNGYVFSQKYESHVKQLGKVHVVVMMNEYPDMTKLSADRYDVVTVSA